MASHSASPFEHGEYLLQIHGSESYATNLVISMSCTVSQLSSR